MKTHLAITARILGGYAAVLAFIHGYFEVQQGRAIVESINIQAIGNGCAADQIWHACFPAITILPTYAIAGFVTMSISTLMLCFILLYLHKPWSKWLIIAFAIANLLCGAGFIPTFTAFISTAALHLQRKPKNNPEKKKKIFINLYSFFIFVYIFYAAFGWLFGSYFNTFMISNRFSLFLGMDIYLPMICVFLAWRLDSK